MTTVDSYHQRVPDLFSGGHDLTTPESLGIKRILSDTKGPVTLRKAADGHSVLRLLSKGTDLEHGETAVTFDGPLVLGHKLSAAGDVVGGLWDEVPG